MGFIQNFGHDISKGFHSVEHIASKGTKALGHEISKSVHKGGVFDQIFQTGKKLVSTPAELLNKGFDILSNPLIIIAIVIGAVIIVPRVIK